MQANNVFISDKVDSDNEVCVSIASDYDEEIYTYINKQAAEEIAKHLIDCFELRIGK